MYTLLKPSGIDNLFLYQLLKLNFHALPNELQVIPLCHMASGASDEQRKLITGQGNDTLRSAYSKIHRFHFNNRGKASNMNMGLCYLIDFLFSFCCL